MSLLNLSTPEHTHGQACHRGPRAPAAPAAHPQGPAQGREATPGTYSHGDVTHVPPRFIFQRETGPGEGRARAQATLQVSLTPKPGFPLLFTLSNTRLPEFSLVEGPRLTPKPLPGL